MSRFFVVEPDKGQDHPRSGSSYTIKGMALKKHAEQQPADAAMPKPYSLSMPPATPPRADSPTQLASPSGSATTLNTSPASTSSGPSLASTGPSSAATSPVTQSSAFNPDNRQPSGRKCSFSTLQIVSASSVKFASKNSTRPLDYSSPSTCASSSTASSPSIRPGIRRGSPCNDFNLNSTLGSLLPTRGTYIPSYIIPSPASFLKTPPLDLNVPTTFGPYKSPHTLSELHSLAWSNKAFPIEPCLQCKHKNLPCPLTLTSPANTHLGPLLINRNNNIVKTTTVPRPLTANPRFPACLRCIRAGEADCCIVQRRATLDEQKEIRKNIRTFAEAALLDTAVVVLPTDRDVADPALFAAKMRRRDELLHQAELRESRTVFAPRRVTAVRDVISSDEEKIELRERRIRNEQERDRVLLGGTGREEVLSPTESWGEKWVGRREWDEQGFVADAKEVPDDALKLVEAEIAKRRRCAGLGGEV